jgi:tripeptidyl-peptidase-1
VPIPPKRTTATGHVNWIQQLETCDVAITPVCIQALYDIPPAISAHEGNEMGIFEGGDVGWVRPPPVLR